MRWSGHIALPVVIFAQLGTDANFCAEDNPAMEDLRGELEQACALLQAWLTEYDGSNEKPVPPAGVLHDPVDLLRNEAALLTRELAAAGRKAAD